MYSSSSISWLILKLLAVIVFEISWLQIFKAKICKGQWLKKYIILFLFSPGYLLIIFYQLTKFAVICWNSFWDILITSFQCQNLQRTITKKNIITFSLIFTRLSTEPRSCYMFWYILITKYICFGWEIGKIYFSYALLSGGLIYQCNK